MKLSGSRILHSLPHCTSRFALALASVAFFSLAPTLARAEAVEAELSRDEDWSLGVGIGGLTGLGNGINGVARNVPLFTYGVGMERRITGPLWLRAGAGTSHQRSLWNGAPDGRSTIAVVRLGARLAFADTGPVEWSAVGDAIAGGGNAQHQSTAGLTSADSVELTGALGVAAEARLTHHVALRLTTTVLQGSYGWYSRRISGLGSFHSRISNFSFQLEPSIDLRFYF